MENVIYFGKNNRPKNIPVFHAYLSIYLSFYSLGSRNNVRSAFIYLSRDLYILR